MLTSHSQSFDHETIAAPYPTHRGKKESQSKDGTVTQFAHFGLNGAATEPHGVNEHLKCGYCDCRTEYFDFFLDLTLINYKLNGHIE